MHQRVGDYCCDLFTINDYHFDYHFGFGFLFVLFVYSPMIVIRRVYTSNIIRSSWLIIATRKLMHIPPVLYIYIIFHIPYCPCTYSYTCRSFTLLTYIPTQHLRPTSNMHKSLSSYSIKLELRKSYMIHLFEHIDFVMVLLFFEHIEHIDCFILFEHIDFRTHRLCYYNLLFLFETSIFFWFCWWCYKSSQSSS